MALFSIELVAKTEETNHEWAKQIRDSVSDLNRLMAQAYSRECVATLALKAENPPTIKVMNISEVI